MSETTTRTIEISDADILALIAIRPVVADAQQHPARAAAIAALDSLAAKLARQQAFDAERETYRAEQQRQREAAEKAVEELWATLRLPPSA
jgi:hypothetical protein